MKHCNKCKTTKTLDMFFKDKKTKDGYKTTCKKCAVEYHKNWCNEKKSHIKKYRQQYWISNKEQLSKNKKQYNELNKDRINDNQNIRYTEDILFKLKRRLRIRIYNALKNNQKSGSAIKDLGCTIEELKKHLEAQFQPGMSWDNWTTDGWHIDHIKPISSFDITNSEELLNACHYTNLQPLWAKDNLRKSDKILGE